MNNNYKKIYKQLTKERNKTIIIIIILIITIITLSYLFINNLFPKPSGKEFMTTKLNNDTDFLEWFVDFDNLYNKKIEHPKYSLTKEHFNQVITILEEDNQVDNLYYKDNIYHLLDNSTLELDVNNRSFRYTYYNNKNIQEIIEVKLQNGKYYVQLINQKNIYQINFNKDKSKIKKIKNKEKEIIIKNSIYSTNSIDW